MLFDFVERFTTKKITLLEINDITIYKWKH